MTLHAGLPPVVAVIGTTGVGKSQLSVSLAQSLARRPVSLGAGIHDVSSSSTNAPGRSVQRALVLSADSMQVYKGLDVITNKITKEEMGGVEHWGLDMIQPGVHRSWDVGKWCLEAGQEVCSAPCLVSILWLIATRLTPCRQIPSPSSAAAPMSGCNISCSRRPKCRSPAPARPSRKENCLRPQSQTCAGSLAVLDPRSPRD